MRIFYYAHTGHRIGLDKFRRAAAIINMLKEDVEITLLTSDYRIASVARGYGIDNCVGIDVVRNIANIAENGDKLIFDSAEANPFMLEDMRNYFSSFIYINDDPSYTPAPNEFVLSPYLEENQKVCKALPIQEEYFGDFEKKVPLSFFFGDDDYEKDLEKNLSFVPQNAALGLGFYYFLDYESMLENKFENTFEFDEYQEMIQTSKVLITASPQAVLEALAAKTKVIYFQRADYTQDFLPLFKELQVPIIQDYDKVLLSTYLEKISSLNTPQIDNDSNKIKDFLRNCLDL